MVGVLLLALAGFVHLSGNQRAVGRSREAKPGDIRSARDNDPRLWSPIVGTGLFVAGILVIVLGKK